LFRAEIGEGLRSHWFPFGQETGKNPLARLKAMLQQKNITGAKPSAQYTSGTNFDVLLTVHLSIFISVFNQIDAQNMFHSKFYLMPLHVSSTCAHHQEVKIALHSLSI